MKTQEVSPTRGLLLLERLEGHAEALTTHGLRGQRLEARGPPRESPDDHLLLWTGILKI